MSQSILIHKNMHNSSFQSLVCGPTLIRYKKEIPVCVILEKLYSSVVVNEPKLKVVRNPT